MECKKCKSISSVILRKKDNYCENCFLASINHKFRSCIGKNRVLVNNENVLLALSSGLGSSVLLELVHSGISLSSHKKLRIAPVCLHIMGLVHQDEEKEITMKLIQTCKNYSFNLHFVHVSSYFNKNIDIPAPFCKPTICDENEIKLNAILKTCQATCRADLMDKLKINILLKVAKALQCSRIFTAETTTTLASKLLSNLSIGRGEQIEYDIGFCDGRDSNVNVFRPMKDITYEELKIYGQMKGIEASNEPTTTDNSLQNLINSFVIDLQENYHATISTLCKTADKIGTNNLNTRNKCVVCQSNIVNNKAKLTALEATHVSSQVCLGVSDTSALSRSLELTRYCYGCIRNLPIDKLEVITM